ncbi:MAG: VapC toxin family PIN domain ribonuclease [Sphingomonas sp.]|nr:MAG: VapC toxin family PIN domain ribonuclease [Sphingomonas sp.]
MTGFLDTNILIYAIDHGSLHRQTALNLMVLANRIAVQSMNEYAHVCYRKLRMEWPDVQLGLSASLGLCAELPNALTLHTHELGLWAAQRYQLAIHGALLIAAALSVNCTTFWSEDLHHGLIIDGRLTIRNPFD